MVVSSKHSHWLTSGMYHLAVADLWLNVANAYNQTEFKSKSPVHDFVSDYIVHGMCIATMPSFTSKSQIYDISNIE